MAQGVKAAAPAAIKLAKSEVGQAAGKAVKSAAISGVARLGEELLNGENVKASVKRNLKRSSEEVAKSVAKIAKKKIEKELDSNKKKKPRRGKQKKVQPKRKSIFD